MIERNKSRIFKLLKGDLQNVDFHQAVNCIQRMAPDKFPIHLAVHSVNVDSNQPPPIVYSSTHMHTSVDEVNILISKTSMVYKITLDNAEHKIDAPAAVWIPAGVQHSANVISGEGFFICLRFNVMP